MSQSSNYRGLSNEEVLQSRSRYGSNILTPPERESLWRLFLQKFGDPIIRILLIAAFVSLGISFIHNEFIETIGIFCAIFLATGVAFWFEHDAQKKFDILNQVNDDTAVKVLRDGIYTTVPKRDIVRDDIIILEAGDEIPADATILESISLQVNESTLTGEPITSKGVDPEGGEDSTYPYNMIYRGTTVSEGHCVAKVTAVGDDTEFGRVAKRATDKSEEETPLNEQLEGLAKLIGVVGFVLALLTFGILFVKDIISGRYDFSTAEIAVMALVFCSVMVVSVKVWMPILYDGFELAGLKRRLPKIIEKRGPLYWLLASILVFVFGSFTLFLFGIDVSDSSSWVPIPVAARFLNYFMVAVTLIVVAVPEGLPMSVTLSLAMSMRRMLLTNNLVRKMHACETMGAATVICTDKTGTLTMNQMSVKHALMAADDHTMMWNMAVNSTALLDLSDSERVKPIGNPTEGALLLWLRDRGVDYDSLRREFTVESQLPFSTERKYMGTIVSRGEDRYLFIKGAPEIVIAMSKGVGDEIGEELSGFQGRAMRTLAFAYTKTTGSDIEQLVKEGVQFQGYVAIEDPVRDDVPVAIKSCTDAGIEVKIVTGDTPGTAKEIGRRIGIIAPGEEDEYVIQGADFEKMDDVEASEAAGRLRIMCRARPGDKQRLVRLLQKRGEVVAVTGDGTNDAPALNYAQVGLSMGSGTSVAKEASDITLLDDSFGSIVTAVMWGRSLYVNIQRFLIFQLTINVTALIVVLLGSIFGHELPLTVTQMLWVNLIMDTFAAGALASLPPDPRVMKSAPRGRNDFIITSPMRYNILVTALFFVGIMMALLFVMRDGSGDISPYNLSLFFTIFVMMQFWNMFNAKRFGSGFSSFKGLLQSRGFIFVSLIIVLGQFLIVTFGGEIFRTVPLKAVDWIIVTASTSLVLFVGEITSKIAGYLKSKREVKSKREYAES